MSVVSMPQVRPNRSQAPWDRRNVAELSQTNFRTALRGFDRDEVRAILDSVAADYRVLQLQNASLQRQLADLEAVLQAYHLGDGPSTDPAPGGQVLQRANDEARTILMRAHAQAQETMSQVAARAREAERPIEQFEQDQRRFRALLAATVSDLLGVLSMTHREPAAPLAEPKQIGGRLLLEAAAAPPDPAAGIAPAAADDLPATSVALVPAAAAPRPAAPAIRTVSAPLSECAPTLESIELLLKSIDRALVDIPALPCE